MLWLVHPTPTAPGRLGVLLLVLLCGAPAARSADAGFSLDAAAGLFWQVELAADDGATSGADTVTFFCCADNDAVVLGRTAGIVDPTFTPELLTHELQPGPLALTVGAIPVTLDLSGSLHWSPPSGPALMSGESGPLDTGPLSSALFVGTLTTPFASLPFGRSLLQHTGGDTTLRRYSGAVDLGPPRLRLGSVSELLDSLEIDEEDLPGRVEMRNPYEAVLLVSQGITEAGSVSYPLDAAAGLFWEITISGDDGVLPPSSDTLVAFQGFDASVSGTTSGVVEPVFTPGFLEHSLAASGLAFQVGAHTVTLDLAGALGWSPPSGPSLAAGQAAPMPTGDASAAAFVGTLTTPFGAVPFDRDLSDHLGGDMTLVRLDGPTELGAPRLQLDTAVTPLDTLQIDEADVSGRVDMRNPYEAVLGSSGGVTWSISARTFFNDAFHGLAPSSPNGAIRDVSWSLRAQVLFNDVFYASDPDLFPKVPALGLPGRLLLASLLVTAALGVRRLRRA